MSNPRLAQQIAFLVEADKLKNVLRRTPLMDASRLENSAEHSWHLALTAVVLAEYAPTQIDVLRVLEIVTVHDPSKSMRAIHSPTMSRRIRRRRTASWSRPTASSGCWPRIKQHISVSCGTNSRSSRLPRLATRMPSIACSRCFRTCSPAAEAWTTHGVTRDDVLRRMAPLQTELPEVWPFVLEVIERFFH